jgi:2-polyprenyl-3-methyl-5-hydroxy-6-metoxy-1,4-benzoquinol methylase
MTSRFLEKLVRFLLGDRFLLVDRVRDGIVRGGGFETIDFTDHEFVDKRKYLVLEKGKYKIIHRDGHKKIGADEGVGMAVIDNSRSSYDDFWRSDETVAAYQEKERREFFKEVLSVCRQYIHGKVVDIGCGSGFFLQLLTTHMTHHGVYGIDFSSSSIARCRKEIPLGKFLLSDIYYLGCRDGTFDTVICMETLEHLDRPGEAVREILRVCRSGGYVIITIPNGHYDQYVGHLNFWSESEFRWVLVDAEVVAFQYVEGGKAMVFVATPK